MLSRSLGFELNWNHVVGIIEGRTPTQPWEHACNILGKWNKSSLQISPVWWDITGSGWLLLLSPEAPNLNCGCKWSFSNSCVFHWVLVIFACANNSGEGYTKNWENATWQISERAWTVTSHKSFRSEQELVIIQILQTVDLLCFSNQNFRQIALVFINGDRAMTIIKHAKYTVRSASCAVKIHLSNERGRTV